MMNDRNVILQMQNDTEEQDTASHNQTANPPPLLSSLKKEEVGMASECVDFTPWNHNHNQIAHSYFPLTHKAPMRGWGDESCRKWKASEKIPQQLRESLASQCKKSSKFHRRSAFSLPQSILKRRNQHLVKIKKNKNDLVIIVYILLDKTGVSGFLASICFGIFKRGKSVRNN